MVSKYSYFLASNHQNLTPIEELKSFLVVYTLEPSKIQFFVKSLNSIVHGTPQTAIRAAIRRSELTSTWKIERYFRDLALPQFLP